MYYTFLNKMSLVCLGVIARIFCCCMLLLFRTMLTLCVMLCVRKDHIHITYSGPVSSNHFCRCLMLVASASMIIMLVRTANSSQLWA